MKHERRRTVRQTYGKASLADILFQKLFSIKKSAQNCSKLRISLKPQDFAQKPLRQPKSTPRPGNRSSSQESQDPGTWIQVSEPRSQDPGIRTLWRTSKPYQDAKIRISAPLRPLYATNFEKNARPCTRPNVFFLTPRIRGTEIFRRDSAKTPCFSTLPAKKRVFRTSEF